MEHPRLPDLHGKTALVTGGAGGLGRGICSVLLAAGANVVVHYLFDTEPVATVLAQLAEQSADYATAPAPRAIALTGDITDPHACEALVAATVAEFGQLNVLINNAGVQPVQDTLSLSCQDFEAVVRTNLTGTFNMTQAAARYMKDHGGGSITHIASVEASLPARNHLHYVSSKAGVKMHARATALEYGQYGIRVNTVSPGLIDAGGLAEAWPQGYNAWCAAVPLGRVCDPVEIGYACAFLASDLAAFVSGADLVADGGMSAVPAW